jgi:ketosteroid isomerase-like protein
VSIEESAEVLRRLFKAFSDRDARTLAELVAEDAVWRIGGRSPVAGEYRGREEIFRLFRLTGELTGRSYRTELRYALGDGYRAVAVYRAVGDRDARRLDIEQVLLCRVIGGQLREVDAVPTDQYAFDEFWS